MELTHKITRCVGSHIEHREDIIEHTFPYVQGGTIEKGGEDWPYTTPFVLKDASSQGAGVHQLKAGGTDIGYWDNASKPLTLPAGSYRVKFPYYGSLVIYKVTDWTENAYVSHVGSYSHNATVQLAAGQYIIASNINDTDLDGLKGALLEVTEYDVVVKDYETTVIEEPIGFDDLQMTMKRHDYHGMGAEVSLGDLEFYGAAFNIIKAAYDADIDGEVIYKIEGDGTTIYEGQVDLTTCSFVRGDYQSVKAKVGEVGVRTTFNNRTSVDIDLNIPKTVDGESVEAVDWMSLHVPLKHLLYTNSAKQRTNNKLTSGGGYAPFPDTGIGIHTDYPMVFIPIGDSLTAEFGQFENQATYTTNSISNVNPQYYANSDHTTKYGSNTKMQLEINLKASIERRDNGWSPIAQGGYIKWHLEAQDSNGHTITGATEKVLQSEVNSLGATWDLSCSLSGELDAGGSVYYYLVFDIDIPSGGSVRYFFAHITVEKNSYVSMKMYDNITEEEVYADMILVHDALNVVSHAISENALSVKSEWFRTPESHWNAGAIRSKSNGGNGALKALTNGYKIRGLYTDEDNERNMPVSFKALIEALDALDCIGWGFSTEDNVLYLRVERWDWFYKDTTILTLTNVAEVTTDVLTDRIPTELKIGYKKYATQDQYNSIDSPHGTRTFTSGIKALAKTFTKECEFVADNYAIEETRRARAQVSETEETTYDENIFVFELMRTQRAVSIGDIGNLSAIYSIPHSAKNPTGVGNAAEFINAKLTPRHMAARWRDYLFAANNSTPFRFTSGEINYKSSFATHPEADMSILVGGSYLDSFAVTSPQKENDDISYSHAKFKAEKITFTCPLSIAQYKTVKANPYGLVSVNGTLGWIMDFKYSLHDGTADFTLLAKYVTQ